MKDLEIETLIRLNTFLEQVDVGDYYVHGVIGAYSCKLQGFDRKLSKSLDDGVKAGSSPLELSKSPVGPLSDSSSRKTLICLILTLNQIYPDYDFSQLKAHHFRKEAGVATAEEVIDSQLLETCRAWEKSPSCADTPLLDTMWTAIDEAVSLENCDVYSYKSDGETDPFGEEVGTLWAFNFFFYNKKLKKILYISCRGTSKVLPQDTSDTQGYSFQTDEDDDVAGNMEDLL